MTVYVNELKIIVNVVNKATKPLDEVSKKLEEIAKRTAKIKEISGALLAGGLSLLFTGQMINRFFSGFLRSAFETYTKIISVNDLFFQKTQQLRAAWEFFKFSLISALGTSPLFLAIIDAVISLVNWFGQLSVGWQRFIAYFVISAIIISALMIAFGATAAFVSGMLILLDKAAKTTLGINMLKHLKNIWPLVAGVASKFGLWALAIGIGLGILLLFEDELRGFVDFTERLFFRIAEATAFIFKSEFTLAIGFILDLLSKVANFLSRYFPKIANFIGIDQTFREDNLMKAYSDVVADFQKRDLFRSLYDDKGKLKGYLDPNTVMSKEPLMSTESKLNTQLNRLSSEDSGLLGDAFSYAMEKNMDLFADAVTKGVENVTPKIQRLIPYE